MMKRTFFVKNFEKDNLNKEPYIKIYTQPKNHPNPNPLTGSNRWDGNNQHPHGPPNRQSESQLLDADPTPPSSPWMVLSWEWMDLPVGDMIPIPETNRIPTVNHPFSWCVCCSVRFQGWVFCWKTPKWWIGWLVFPTSKWWVMMIMYDVMVMFHYQCGAITLDINGSVRKYVVSSIQVESQVLEFRIKFSYRSCTLYIDVSLCCTHNVSIATILKLKIECWRIEPPVIFLFSWPKKTAHVSKFQSLDFTKHLKTCVSTAWLKKLPTGCVPQQCSRDVPHPSPKAVEWPAFPKNQRLPPNFTQKENRENRSEIKLNQSRSFHQWNKHVHKIEKVKVVPEPNISFRYTNIQQWKRWKRSSFPN